MCTAYVAPDRIGTVHPMTASSPHRAAVPTGRLVLACGADSYAAFDAAVTAASSAAITIVIDATAMTEPTLHSVLSRAATMHPDVLAVRAPCGARVLEVLVTAAITGTHVMCQFPDLDAASATSHLRSSVPEFWSDMATNLIHDLSNDLNQDPSRTAQ